MRVQGSEFRDSGLGFRVQGLGVRVQGSGFRVGYRDSLSAADGNSRGRDCLFVFLHTLIIQQWE